LEELQTEAEDTWLRHEIRENSKRMIKNAELLTKWTKKPWKTFEETIRRGRYRSIKG